MKRVLMLLGGLTICAGTAFGNDSRPVPDAVSEPEGVNLADTAGPAGAENTGESGAAVTSGEQAAKESALAAASPPVYVPPRRGAPKTRVGGGTRSGGPALEVALLAPEHTGITAQASPTLFWWLSDPFEGEIEFVVTRKDAVQPEFRERRTLALDSGIHSVDLAQAGVELAPGEIYQWAVAVIRDPDRRSRDLVAVATLEFDPRVGVASAVPASLAAAGLFYDAIAALSTGGARGLEDKADLLDQVALGNVASWIRDEG
jgi:hypothetical protein